LKALTNILVFGLLVGITAGELLIINLQLSRQLLVSTLIGLAGLKALFVVAYFQQVKEEPRSLSILLLTGVVIASLLMTISFLQLHPIHA
jgi:Prokaryotic Cytochrome C oxidase subunit IV